jgi:hypothetical protein
MVVSPLKLCRFLVFDRAQRGGVADRLEAGREWVSRITPTAVMRQAEVSPPASLHSGYIDFPARLSTMEPRMST